MLYLCIHDVRLLFTLSGSFKKAGGEEREGGRNTFWHSTCMLPYWLKGPGRNQDSLCFSQQKRI